MGRIGLPELIIVLVIILLLFGASRLPQVGHALGKSVNMFKKGLNDTDEGVSKSDGEKSKDGAKAVEETTSKAQSTQQH